MNCVTEKEMFRLLSGALEASQTAALQTHLRDCESCTRLQQQLLKTTSRLAPDPGEFEDPNLAGDVLTLIRLGRAEAPQRAIFRPFWRNLLLAPVAVAAILLAVVFLRPEPEPDTSRKFQVRGSRADAPDRWVSLAVFRDTAQGFQPVQDSIMADNALAFTYNQQQGATFRYLMILGVDESGAVFWYYPEHDSEHANPLSIAIQPGQHQLPDKVQHQLKPGRLRIFALFSREALDVLTIEGLVNQTLPAVGSLDRLDRLEIPDCGQQSLLLKVLEAR